MLSTGHQVAGERSCCAGSCAAESGVSRSCRFQPIVPLGGDAGAAGQHGDHRAEGEQADHVVLRREQPGRVSFVPPKLWSFLFGPASRKYMTIGKISEKINACRLRTAQQFEARVGQRGHRASARRRRVAGQLQERLFEARAA